MPDLILEIDAAGSNLDGTNPGSALVITTGNYGLASLDLGSPSFRHQWVSSVDSEGAAIIPGQPDNRTIRVELHVTGDAALYALEGKLGKLHREGGTIRYTTPAADVVTFDVRAHADYLPIFDHLHYLGGLTQVTFSLVCDPYGRGAEVDLGDNVETTSPALIFTEASIPGDVPGLPRFVVDNDASADQAWLVWGAESSAAGYTFTDSTGSGALLYEAESRTALGASATAAGPSGASGGGSNVMRNTSLLTTYQAVLSTQASGGGAHLTHIGTFRAYARVQIPTTNTGTVTVAFEWGVGEYLNPTVNQGVEVPTAGRWLLLDLGLAHITPTGAGTHRWEGRILAKSTVAGDDLDVDYLMFVPAGVGSGVAAGIVRDANPSAFSARDEFTGTTSGSALNARTPPVGAAWATSGAATDFAFIDAAAATSNDSEAVSRSAVSGRFAVLGSAITAMEVRVRQGIEFGALSGGTCSATGGVIARWTDVNNYISFEVTYIATTAAQSSWQATFAVVKTVASVETTLWTSPAVTMSLTGSQRLALNVATNGFLSARGYNDAGQVVAEFSTVDSDFATGGALDDGKGGILDGGGTGTSERWYDDVVVFVPPQDAAIFASQSLEIRHDGADRENSAGTAWSRVSNYRGSYLRVPPSGAEGRSVRFIAKGTRTDPLLADSAIDDISARLFVVPRYLVVPEP